MLSRPTVEQMVESAINRVSARKNATRQWASSVDTPTLQAKIAEYEKHMPGCKPRDSEMVARILADLRLELSTR